MSSEIDSVATAATKAHYNRIARFYDLMESASERLFKSWRQRLWAQAQGGNILEVGVGTGKNFPYYPRGIRVMGIDLADQMLVRARERARRLGAPIELREGDVQALAFPDKSFDRAIAA